MAKVLNFGSINIDHVYSVNHFVRPGETLSSEHYHRFPGGKGLNQSIALSHAGACVHHAGNIGKDDLWLKTLLEQQGVDASSVAAIDEPTGHAIIQVSTAGENSIVIFGGANQCIAKADITRIVGAFSSEDYLLVQNETNAVPEILRAAKARGLTVVFNPAPMTSEVLDYPLDLVDIFVVNETEGQGLTSETRPEKIQNAMREQYPNAATVLTLGDKGALYLDSKTRLHQPGEHVNSVDTTGAGDTFTGFFLAGLIETEQPKTALELGCRAAALCVTRAGAANSIPLRADLK